MALVLLKKFDLKERAYLILSGHNAADNYAWTPRVFLSETRNRLANGSSSFIVDDENPNRVGRLYELAPRQRKFPARSSRSAAPRQSWERELPCARPAVGSTDLLTPDRHRDLV